MSDLGRVGKSLTQLSLSAESGAPAAVPNRLGRRRKHSEEPALRASKADDWQELLPARPNAAESLLLHGTDEPLLRASAFEVEGDTLIHRDVAFGTDWRSSRHSRSVNSVKLMFGLTQSR